MGVRLRGDGEAAEFVAIQPGYRLADERGPADEAAMTGEIWGAGHHVALLLLIAVFYLIARCLYWLVASIFLRPTNPHSRAFTAAQSNPSDEDRTENES